VLTDSEDREFEEWKDHLMLLDPRERSMKLLEKAKEQVSEQDRKALDDIVKLIEDNPDKHTDLMWVNEQMSVKYPDINPLAVMTYFFILNACGIIMLDNA